MRRSVLLAVLLACASGVFAAISIYSWMISQSELAKRRVAVPGPQIDLTTVVVAKEDLNFGMAIKKDKLEEVQWPTRSVPAGSFRTVQAFFTERENRVVTMGMKRGEAVVGDKVTGPGQRASLSTMLEHGKKAISIRVNEVVGVSGFVLPGDRIDIIMTRTMGDAKAGKGGEAQSYAALLLQNMRVLAIDQTADPKQDAPKLARTVTLEATLEEAQKITLAGEIGSLSIVLRENSSLSTLEDPRRMTISDLSGDNGDKDRTATFAPTNAVAPAAAAVPTDAGGAGSGSVKVNVIRSVLPTEYSVQRATANE
jgi:pilus assembly protein CpaB